MDKEKEQHFWTQSPWGILILASIGGIISTLLSTLIADFFKGLPILSTFKNLWNYLIKTNIPLIWVLVTMILIRLIWVLFRRTKLYNKFFDKKYASIHNEYASLKKEYTAAYGRVKTLDEEYTKQTEHINQLNKELENTKKELTQLKQKLSVEVEDHAYALVEINDLKQKLESAKSELSKISIELTKYEDIERQLKRKIEEYQVNKGALLGEIVELTELLNQTQTKLKEVEGKLGDSQVSLLDKTNQLEESNRRISLLTEVNKPEKPPYFNYTQDTFKNLIWEWEWAYDSLAKDWYIIDLHPLCPKCGEELIDKSIAVNTEYSQCKCPECNITFGYAVDDYSESEDAEDIEYIRKRIKSKVKKGNYPITSRS